MSGTIHVVGAGLAGLAAAVRLMQSGRKVVLYEAAGQAGGRCRSYQDIALDRRIDNGNHLLFSGNHAAMGYLRAIGAVDTLDGPERAEFPFLDLESGESWTVKLDRGRIQLGILSSHRRIPGTTVMDYLGGIKFLLAGASKTVAECFDPSRPMYRKFWEPLAVAALNTSGDDGAAKLLWPVLRETFGKGEAASRPRYVREGLSESFIEPALLQLKDHGTEIRLNTRLKELATEDQHVTGLDFGIGPREFSEDDVVILALPPRIVSTLLPDIDVPEESRAIVNGHFILPQPINDWTPMGLIGGTAQWLFARGDVASVTVSAADQLADETAEAIAEKIWPEILRALNLGNVPLGKYRIVKEKRATFAQTPDQVAKRPGTHTGCKNLFLAGDWTNTGLPATIEGAIRSGNAAADAARRLVPTG
jgi:squalene-associated FAD-dependent desaturase